MLTADHLAEAERLGIISPAQRIRLAELAAGRPAVETSPGVEPTDPGEESFRLVGGGNDVFVGIGIILLLAGFWSAVSTFLPVSGMFTYGLVIAFVWALAEFITRRRRMKFSSLILAFVFTIGCATLIGLALHQSIDLTLPENPINLIGKRSDYRIAGLFACGGLAGAAIVYFARFKVPFMAAVMALSAIGLLTLLITDVLFSQVLAFNINITDEAEVSRVTNVLLYVPLLCGLLVFATAVFLDIRDRHRETVLSDCAFWLHVISAPLIVHPLFMLATGQTIFFENGEASNPATGILIALIVLFFYVALAIDRRSLLIPSLGYFGTVGIYYLVNAASQSTGVPPVAVILLVIGVLVIVFGVGWQRIRVLVVATTLPHILLEKLPPVKS